MNDAVVRLDECLSIRDGELFIEGCRTLELARRFGTPLHVVSEDQLRRNARRLESAFASRWPGELLLLPSIKANSSLALRRILTDEGTGCDVFGPGELEAALRAGTGPERISLNGPMKDEALLERAIREGVRITLDSRAELSRTAAAAARLGKRRRSACGFVPTSSGSTQPSEMSPDGASVRDAIQRYKAGIPTEDILAIGAAEIARPQPRRSTGIHFHLGRHSTDPAIWSAAIDGAVRAPGASCAHAGTAGLPRELDVGRRLSGPARPVRPVRSPSAPTLPRGPSGRRVRRCDLPAACRRPRGARDRSRRAIRLEIEPGRALYADAGHPPGDGGQRQAPDGAGAADLGGDRLLRRLPADVNLELNRWTCLPVMNAAADGDDHGRHHRPDLRARRDRPRRRAAAGRARRRARVSRHRRLPGRAARRTSTRCRARARRSSAAPSRADPPPRDPRGRLRARPDPGAPARRAGCGGRPQRLAATGIDHVSVTCGDLDRSLGFYCDLLGLELRARGDAEAASSRSRGSRTPRCAGPICRSPTARCWS